MTRRDDTPNTAVHAGPDIFLSYARENHETAHQLAAALSEQGWKVWWDREISGGAAFADVITEQLTQARLVLVLWSAASTRSIFVRDEASRALDAGKLLPIRIEDVELPIGFGQIQTLDLTDWTGSHDKENLRRVIEEIRHLLQRDLPPQKQRSFVDKPPVRRKFSPVATLLALLVIVGVGLWMWSPRFNPGNRQRAEEHTLQGINHLAAKEYGQARARFNLAISASRRFAPAYFYLAQVLIQDDAKEEAGKSLRRALKLQEGLDGAQLAEAELWLKELEAATDEPKPIAVAQNQPPPPAPVVAAPPPPPPGVPSALPPSASAAPPASPPQATARSSLRVPPPPERLTTVTAAVEQMFAEQKETRIAATTNLVINPESVSDAVSVAVDRALTVQKDGSQTSPTEQSGVINALVLLQSALPATLNANREKIETLLQRARANGEQTTEQVNKVAASLRQAKQQRPLVYIQIANEAQRSLANTLRKQLQEAGYDAPRIELVSNKAPAKISDIRVHGNSDRGWARWLARKLTASGADDVRILTLRNVRAKNDTFEIWLDRDLCVTPERQNPLCRA